jgi:5-methylcytosine-specific restriction endonuclease McrA
VTFAPRWIDHIVAEKHGGKTEAENLANSCVVCNQRKGSDLSSIDPETGHVVTLFHPRRDRWTDHFRLLGARIQPLTPAGRATERLLQLNHPDRVEERGRLIELGLYQVP